MLDKKRICHYYIIVRVFKTKRFSKLAQKEEITDDELLNIVTDVLEKNNADANLGGDVFKVRMARENEGKSGGYRVIVFFRSGERTLFHYFFTKSERDNISPKELKWFKDVAKDFLSISDNEIKTRLESGTLNEIFRG